jgi:hypothetical protein
MSRGTAPGEKFTDAEPDSGKQRLDTPFPAGFQSANPTIWQHRALDLLKPIAFAFTGDPKKLP